MKTMHTTHFCAAALLGALTVLAVTPVVAQSGPAKPSKQERQAMSKSQRAVRKAERKMEKRDAKMGDTMNAMGQRNSPGMMSGGMMSGDTTAPSMMNNTAAVQANIDRANKTLNDMTALLNQMDARHRGGSQ